MNPIQHRIFFRKRIEKLDIYVSRNVQIIATMRHEMDILSSNRASYKAIETENCELKSKLDLMMSIESVLTASQREVDEILKQNLNSRDLSVMVGTLRRELNSNEIRKNELRKQLQAIKNDLRAEQEERRKLQDRLNFYESENHSLRNRLRRLEKSEAEEVVDDDVVGSSDVETPEPAKRPRLALKNLGDLNTPSPLSHVSSLKFFNFLVLNKTLYFQDEFQNRVAQVRESDSPYLKVKSSSIALSCVLKKPMQMRETHQAKSGIPRSKSNDGFNKLSIFNKPRITSQGLMQTFKSENVAYNGVGGTTKVLQSDLTMDSMWASTSKPMNAIKKKKLSPLALGK